MSENDLVIEVSGSGNSENVLKAIRYCNEHGGRTFGICGYGGGKLKDIANKSLVIESNDIDIKSRILKYLEVKALQRLNIILVCAISPQ